MPGRKEAVLVVDDRKNWCELISGLLADDYHVVSAQSYEEALTAIRSQTPPFHAAVMDIRLVDEDVTNEAGLDLIEELNRASEFTKAIVVTAYPEGRIRRVVRLQPFDYLEKLSDDGTAFDHVEFLKSVREAVDQAERQRVPTAFVLMPFDEEYQAIYEEVVRKVIQEQGLVCKRADDLYQPHRIMDDINKSIRQATFLIADLSGRNPNVFYEVGVAHAIGQAVVSLTRSIDDIPPKLHDVRCIVYEDSLLGARKLERDLTSSILELKNCGYSCRPLFEQHRYRIDPELCFAFVTDTEEGRGAYGEIVQWVAQDFGLVCKSAESVFSLGHVMDDIWTHINQARVVIADLSGKDPEVFYLVGICHALGKDVVLLTHNEADVPFDLRGQSCIVYAIQSYSQRQRARERLSQGLKEALEKREMSMQLEARIQQKGLLGGEAQPAASLADFEVELVRELVSRNEFREALSRLDNVPHLRNQAALILQRLDFHRRQERESVLPRNEIDTGYTKIAKDILDLISS